MHFTGDITLGNLLTILTLLGMALGFGRKLGSFETTLREHASALLGSSNRLNQHEERILNIVSSLQRVIGQTDIMLRQSDVLHRRVTDTPQGG